MNYLTDKVFHTYFFRRSQRQHYFPREEGRYVRH